MTHHLLTHSFDENSVITCVKHRRIHYFFISEDQMLRFLAIGDSLTAGYSEFGSSFHPYAIHLTNLFSSVNIPIIVNEQGVSGEHVLPAMVKRLENLLFNKDHLSYDWVIILGGTNDLGYRKSAEQIYQQGLKVMYDMVLQHTTKTTKLAVMTVIENGYYSPKDVQDKQRQLLNEMIRNYAQNSPEQNRICLIDLDQQIPYHSEKIEDINQRKYIWDDFIHLKATGYDLMAKIIFKEISNKIN